ncbi:bifunctional 2-polyprenyl-6-hydroxyphenol methylase/3-demethylubiquinol 3-O-methyltransferase UbiG [Cellulomonas sp. Leaf334]|uniref:class I SAM-dependent methyltransferase n=1 Tax=Cellulomonas sp. Leaf334 TaxID=1736339 RepID=UPI0006F8740B|nr:class I SAM-dependent methyltransferase [Cellulomonas sp. Leaf334]KQR15929.1 SAM-dependent methyltransferase [Cellulomonas sp. Leaf334]
MSTDLFETPAADAAPAAFADRIMAATLGGIDLVAIHLGRTLGWYQALVDDGPLTSVDLAARTGTQERYAREWLEQQAVGGWLLVDDHDDATRRRYQVAPGAVAVLTDPDSALHVAPVAGFVIAACRRIDDLVAASRSGGGVSWSQFGDDARTAQAALNRPLFLDELPDQIVPAIPELHTALQGGARVADIGTGEGWSSIGLAAAFPTSTFEGFDVDEPSVAAASRHAADRGLDGRVSFAAVDAAALSESRTGAFDVVMAYECVHDMPDPVGVLAAMRAIAHDDGYVLVMDERTAESFAAPADPVERLLYGYSIVCCLPDGLSTPGGVGTGTVMRPAVLAGYAASAGFSRVEILPVEHEMFRFYRLHL